MRSLVYYELPVYTKTYEEIERDSLFGAFKKSKSVKLLEGVENIEFTFYGYNLLQRKYTWSGEFDGKRRKILPSAVVISYRNQGKRDKLIFGTHVNSFSKTVYNELYQKQ
jgi:general secretion pathway protein J